MNLPTYLVVVHKAFHLVEEQTEARFGIIWFDSVQLGSVQFGIFKKNQTEYLQDKIKEKRILREVSFILSKNGVWTIENSPQ